MHGEATSSKHMQMLPGCFVSTIIPDQLTQRETMVSLVCSNRLGAMARCVVDILLPVLSRTSQQGAGKHASWASADGNNNSGQTPRTGETACLALCRPSYVNAAFLRETGNNALSARTLERVVKLVRCTSFATGLVQSSARHQSIILTAACTSPYRRPPWHHSDHHPAIVRRLLVQHCPFRVWRLDSFAFITDQPGQRPPGPLTSASVHCPISPTTPPICPLSFSYAY